MAINFPNSPVDGQIYVDPVSNSRYVYEAATSRWKSIQYTTTIVSYGFQAANAAFAHANSAYNQGNTSAASLSSNWAVTNAVSDTANASYTFGNSAYASINSNWTVTNALYSVANSAFDSANNVGPQIAPTYNTANNAYNTANNAYNTTNAAYTFANSAYASVNSNWSVLNAAYNVTNTSFASINSNWSVLNAAYSVANSAYGAANNVAPQIAPAYNTANAAYNYANASNTYAGSTFLKLTAPSQTITGDISITGNFTLLGNATSVSTSDLMVGDSLIYLAANNYTGTDILDIGFLANYGNTTGANVHTGLIRDATTKQYYLFNGLDIELQANNTAFVPYANGVVNAVLNADFVTSNLSLGGANAINWITSAYNSSNADYVVSNSAFGVANAAYGQGNTTSASLSSNWTVTNTVYGVANAAYGAANNVGPQIAPAFNTANAAYNQNNVAFGVANAGFGKANTALQNTSGTLAGSLSTTGTITSNGFVYVTASDGVQEGGEIQLSGAGNYAGWALDAYQNNHRIFVRTGSTLANINYFHALGGSVRMGINKTDPLYTLDISGTGYASSDFRAPIFYDSQDTGYYCDPNGTSNFNAINTQGTSAGSGYAKLVNGIIIQWGSQSVCANCKNLYNFPIAFPSNCYGFAATGDWSDSGGWQVCGGSPANSSQYYLTNVIEGSRQIYWMAIGY